MAEVCPSILEVKESLLVRSVLEAQEAGADRIHVDVISEEFASGGTVGLDENTVRYLKRIDSFRLPVEAHLMVPDPSGDIDAYADADVDRIIIHLEKSVDGDFHDEEYIRDTIEKIREIGLKIGIALNPSTPVAIAINYLDNIKGIDEVLVMSVIPGRSGQKFDERVLYKAESLRSVYGNLVIGMDGGINEETGRQAVDAGVSKLISSSYIFNGGISDPIKKLKSL